MNGSHILLFQVTPKQIITLQIFEVIGKAVKEGQTGGRYKIDGRLDRSQPRFQEKHFHLKIVKGYITLCLSFYFLLLAKIVINVFKRLRK